MKPAFTIYFLLFFTAFSFAQKTAVVSSPDGSLVFALTIKKGSPFYRITYKGLVLIDDSRLSIETSEGTFGNNITLQKATPRRGTDDYELFAGKTKHVHDEFWEASFPMQEKAAPFQKLNLAVKVFNDGLAFRYEFPSNATASTLTLLEENTTFTIKGNPLIHALLLPNYTTSHEGLYSHLSVNEISKDTLMDMPTLFQFPSKVYMAITEAALLDYAGMYLARSSDNTLISKLSPLPHQTAIKVKATLPHQSPWRVLIISNRLGAVLESNIITSLNEPTKLTDLSWLKPGKTTFPWWNGNVVPDTLNAPGNNFVTAQYYIDFCARNKIDYHSVVEYGLHQWYTDDGVGFQPGPHADVTTPVPGLNMKEICDYAHSKGVGIRVWVHWAALYPKLDTAFAMFEKWGISGMMVDFMDRDDQEMVNIQTEILQKAAAHHLHIQFHGAYKPTGINRTYPNEFTREGTLNYEADKWNPKGVSPDHDLDIVFTRMIAGSTDYHLGGFRAVEPSKFKMQYTRPLVLGTRCHMMAMYVVLENYLGMVCDYPAAYEGEKGFDFIQKMPTTWDETKLLDGEVRSHAIMARRKGSDWYIGAINNSQSRMINVPLQFLQNGTYNAEIYFDVSAQQPNAVNRQQRRLTNKDSITLSLVGGGGAVVHLTKE